MLSDEDRLETEESGYEVVNKKIGPGVLYGAFIRCVGPRQSGVLAQETDDPAKIAIYNRFVANRTLKSGAAIKPPATISRSIRRTKTNTLTIFRSGSCSTSATSASGHYQY